MRRFSQRNSLVTLNDINITPLLDLAFVLLIIFIITTPLLEKGLDLKLPPANGRPDKQIRKEDVRTVEISNTGIYFFDKQRQTVDQIGSRLQREFGANPNLVVFIRADRKSPIEYFVALTDDLQNRGITRYSIRTQPLQNQ